MNKLLFYAGDDDSNKTEIQIKIDRFEDDENGGGTRGINKHTHIQL
jgi:hypothetical protein